MEMRKDDWRLFNQDQYLMGKNLKTKHFILQDSNIDHVHCEFCWAKFSENFNDLHDGYVTLDERYWICPTCYADFKLHFHWNLESLI